MDDHVACLQGITAALQAKGLDPGSINHSLEQLRVYFQDASRNLTVVLEQKVADATGRIVRVVDVVTTGVIEGLSTRIHTEIKTGLNLRSALDLDQLQQDAILAIRSGSNQGIEQFRNIWQLTNLEFNEDTRQVLQRRMEQLRQQLIEAGFSPEQIRAALASFNFVDKAGRAMTTELESKPDMFGKAMEVVSVKLSEAA